jgi:hypothetical protein
VTATMNEPGPSEAVRLWRQLTARSRQALLEREPARAHPNTRRALVRRGLLDADGGLTPLARVVLRHRPVHIGPPVWRRRPVYGPMIDIHLPD